MLIDPDAHPCDPPPVTDHENDTRWQCVCGRWWSLRRYTGGAQWSSTLHGTLRVIHRFYAARKAPDAP